MGNWPGRALRLRPSDTDSREFEQAGSNGAEKKGNALQRRVLRAQVTGWLRQNHLAELNSMKVNPGAEKILPGSCLRAGNNYLTTN